MSFENINILAINAGSSSIKFALYKCGKDMELLHSGKIERIGLSGTTLSFNNGEKITEESLPLEAGSFSAAENYLIEWLAHKINFSHIKAVGNRLDHSMQHLRGT